MVETFKINIHNADEAHSISRLILEHFPDSCIDFDLDGCDRIFQIDSKENIKENIKELLHAIGFKCNELL